MPLNFNVHINIFGQKKENNYPQHIFFYNQFNEIEPFFSLHETRQWAEQLARNPTIVLIDECHMVMPSRFCKNLPPFVLTFLSQSRKVNCDIFFTTQAIARVDLVLRELTEEWSICDKLLFWIAYSITDIDIDIKDPATWAFEEIKTRYYTYPKRYYDLYNTNHIIKLWWHLSKLEEKKISSENKIYEFINTNYK